MSRRYYITDTCLRLLARLYTVAKFYRRFTLIAITAPPLTKEFPGWSFWILAYSVKYPDRIAAIYTWRNAEYDISLHQYRKPEFCSNWRQLNEVRSRETFTTAWRFAMSALRVMMILSAPRIKFLSSIGWLRYVYHFKVLLRISLLQKNHMF